MYMPVPAISQAITAPIGPVALAKLRGSEKMPAPTMLPTTIAVSAIRVILSASESLIAQTSCVSCAPTMPANCHHGAR